MKKILFVCHGNICRSPMAEFIMKDLLRARGLEDRYEIHSAATSAEENGEPLHTGAAEVLEENGVHSAEHTARQLTKGDYGAFDLLVGMDSENMRNMLRFFGEDPEHKLRLLLDFAGESRDIADPWWTRDFKTAFKDVERGCRGLLDALERGDI